MTTWKAREPSIVRTAVALLATLYAATFVMAVLLHVASRSRWASSSWTSLGGRSR